MFSRRRHDVEKVELTLAQVQSLPAIPSGYVTDIEFRLRREDDRGSIVWTLVEHRLPRSVHKKYDDGERASWIESYADAGPPETLRFLGAKMRGSVEGLATWTFSEWNETLWLVDLRVREKSRGMGVGTSLVRALEDICEEQKLRGIFVETQSRNVPAIRFYTRCGFQISGFNDHLYTNQDLGNGEVAVFLFRETGID